LTSEAAIVDFETVDTTVVPLLLLRLLMVAVLGVTATCRVTTQTIARRLRAGDTREVVDVEVVQGLSKRRLLRKRPIRL